MRDMKHDRSTAVFFDAAKNSQEVPHEDAAHRSPFEPAKRFRRCVAQVVISQHTNEPNYDLARCVCKPEPPDSFGCSPANPFHGIRQQLREGGYDVRTGYGCASNANGLGGDHSDITNPCREAIRRWNQ
jgi:hypothetical protein